MTFLKSIVANHASAGSQLALRTTDPRHFSVNGEGQVVNAPRRGGAGFLNSLMPALLDISRVSHTADSKVKQFAINPSNIGIEDVTISLSKAESSLHMMKAITDRIVRAYKELSVMR